MKQEKEYFVFGFNQDSRMSGFYEVPESLVNSIKEGDILISEHFNSISSIKALDEVREVFDNGNENDEMCYSGRIIGKELD